MARSTNEDTGVSILYIKILGYETGTESKGSVLAAGFCFRFTLHCWEQMLFEMHTLGPRLPC